MFHRSVWMGVVAALVLLSCRNEDAIEPWRFLVDVGAEATDSARSGSEDTRETSQPEPTDVRTGETDDVIRETVPDREPTDTRPDVECMVRTDCASGVCRNGECAESTCEDGVQNGNEAGVDCGGPGCDPCDFGNFCKVDPDCQSSVCSKQCRCLRPDCDDGVQNGSETDIDCGGPKCKGCPNQKRCEVDADCRSGQCLQHACVAPTCTNGVRDGTETDVDCGGGDCRGCEVGRRCEDAYDCKSRFCKGGTCKDGGSCTDGVQNGAETDVDCGGPVCQPCYGNPGCDRDSDCQSNKCNEESGECLPPLCCDRMKNGSESGVDCGGPACRSCPPGKQCNLDKDCKSNVCSREGVCQAPTCEDGIQNGDEAGTDCGGDCEACDSDGG